MVFAQGDGPYAETEGDLVVDAHIHQLVHEGLGLQSVGARHQHRGPDHDIPLTGETRRRCRER